MAFTQITKLFTSCSGYEADEASSSTSSSKPTSLSELKETLSNTSDSTNVRILSISEYKEAALSLAIAFADDDVSNYFLDTDERATWTEAQKWDLHLCIMEYMVVAHVLKGLVTSAGDDYSCIALWMPPGATMDDLMTTMRSGIWRLCYQLCREGRARFFQEFFPLLHNTKVSTLGERDDESWYLVYIGTKPEGRGQGLARKSIEFVTKMADEQGAPCYLESSNERNPAIYAKLGFEVTSRITLKRAEKEVAMDIMVREPVMKTRSIISSDASSEVKA